MSRFFTKYMLYLFYNYTIFIITIYTLFITSTVLQYFYNISIIFVFVYFTQTIDMETPRKQSKKPDKYYPVEVLIPRYKSCMSYRRPTMY